jgi:LemA protein
MKQENTDFLSMYKWHIVVVVIALVLVVWIGGAYNSFIKLDQTVQAQWSEVENQYQRQADLIPNLVSTVSSAVTVETKFVTSVTEARSKWQAAKTNYDKDLAGVDMNNAITAFVNAVATTEAYPTLQANKQYTSLFDELTGTQNRLAVARGRYIEAIQAYNIAVKTFPNNALAGMFGFVEKAYYQATAELVTPTIGTGQLP